MDGCCWLLCNLCGEYRAAKTCEDLKGGAPLGLVYSTQRTAMLERIPFYKVQYITACVNLHFPMLSIWTTDGNSVVILWVSSAIQRPVAKFKNIFFFRTVVDDLIREFPLPPLIQNRASYFRQYLFRVSTEHISLLLSIMLNWSIEGNLILHITQNFVITCH